MLWLLLGVVLWLNLLLVLLYYVYLLLLLWIPVAAASDPVAFAAAAAAAIDAVVMWLVTCQSRGRLCTSFTLISPPLNHLDSKRISGKECLLLSLSMLLLLLLPVVYLHTRDVFLSYVCVSLSLSMYFRPYLSLPRFSLLLYIYIYIYICSSMYIGLCTYIAISLRL